MNDIEGWIKTVFRKKNLPWTNSEPAKNIFEKSVNKRVSNGN